MLNLSEIMNCAAISLMAIAMFLQWRRQVAILESLKIDQSDMKREMEKSISAISIELEIMRVRMEERKESLVDNWRQWAGMCMPPYPVNVKSDGTERKKPGRKPGQKSKPKEIEIKTP